ncbi:hypothetical protein [Marinomonas sp. THO17]|uniref:hypothetical protein n=1 Tax=Marinomonas sp. THO17 TaxID=3149048 RepID=UPI00336BE682
MDNRIKVFEIDRSKPLSIRKGQPNDRPEELLIKLVDYFRNDETVEKSVLGLVEFADAPVLGLFAYVVGVYGSENSRVIPDLKNITFQVNMERWPIVFADMEFESGLVSDQNFVIYDKHS